MRTYLKKNVENVLKWLAIICISSGVVVISFFAYRLWTHGYRFYGEMDNSVSSQVGSFIGGVVGPVWTLATFFILYLALTKQSKQIAEQIEEQRQARFESTFFNLIKTHHEITNNIRIDYKRLTSSGEETFELRGREVFSWYASDLKNIYKFLSATTFEEAFKAASDYDYVSSLYEITENDFKEVTGRQSLDVARKTYQLFFNKFHYLIGHYFRHLYHILKFIDDNKGKEIERLMNPTPEQLRDIENTYYKYAGFVQAQMSSDELFVLFYNQLKFPKMGKLVEDYNVLENLAFEDLIIESHKEFYKKSLKSTKELAI